MADLASLEDLETVWRSLSVDESAAAAKWLAWASALVRREVPTVDARVSSGVLSAELVSSVVVAMVQRAMDNPSGARSVSETIEEYSRQVTMGGDGDGTRLFLTDRELGWLAPRSGRAFSIRPGGAR